MPAPYVTHPPVRPDDPGYIAAATAEAAFWAAPEQFSVVDGWFSAADGPIKRHYNRRLTGDVRTPWFDTIARHGPYRRGLVLGCGGLLQEARILETNPGVHLTFCDIDETGLARRAETFGARFPGRVETRVVDLNFAEFEEGMYDLIISASTLHHIVNLEHVAQQIARALTADGWFFLYDYTGESGMRFPEQQKRVFELIYAREQTRNPGLAGITWHDVDDGTYSPFEAVRGGETIDILSACLHETERRIVGAVMGLLFFAGLVDDNLGRPPPRRADPWTRFKDAASSRPRAAALVWEDLLSAACLDELALADTVACDAGLFCPNNSFVSYRKKA